MVTLAKSSSKKRKKNHIVQTQKLTYMAFFNETVTLEYETSFFLYRNLYRGLWQYITDTATLPNSKFFFTTYFNYKTRACPKTITFFDTEYFHYKSLETNLNRMVFESCGIIFGLAQILQCIQLRIKPKWSFLYH